MTTSADLAAYTDELLYTTSTPDYPNAVNGLQLENRSSIRGIAAAVDFSTRAIRGAIENGANFLIVHHGMFWGGLEPISGPSYRTLRMLMENDIAVYSSHLPLDRHPTLGNNSLLAAALGLTPTGSFAHFQDIFIGLSGESDIETDSLTTRAREFARSYGEIRTSVIPTGRRTRKWGICTGAGASAETLSEASATGIDTLIVGEGPHWTAVHAEEHDLAIIYAGHYATETLGVRALAQHLGEKRKLPWTFISAPTGL
ncbi:MAG: Nif3-like dinuclear metal center hexameric protein [Gemmatimonadota bacterium]|nr:Nif3-like dinuclear metal center hexameric protein [Gemmatimonadota bacterium]